MKIAKLLVVLTCVSFLGSANEAEDTNAFGFDLYTKTKDNPGNISLAPFCIRSALSIPYFGSRGETAAEMKKTLHFKMKTQETLPILAKMTKELAFQGGEKDPLTLLMANAFWVEKNLSFVLDFLRATTLFLESDFKEIDFSDQPEGARHEINRWVRQETKGKIPELFTPGQITGDTRAVVTSTLYFKGLWEKSFDPKETKNEPFHSSNEQSNDVAMMHQTEHFPFAETESYSIIELPFGKTEGQKQEVSLYVLLPKEMSGLTEVEKILQPKSLHEIQSKLKMKRVDLFLPKFHGSMRLELNDALTSLGMKEAFSTHADFSGMIEGTSLMISHVIHEVSLELDEVGAIAAAATGVEMRLTAFLPEEPILFRADHPFIYVLQEKTTGTILLMGRVSKVL